MGSEAKVSWQAGDEIADRYLLEKRIGSGGMGAVFRARDLKLNKLVAVKTITGIEPDDTSLIRFHREAKIASHIDHKNVVKIYDFGVEADNRPYLVMEYLEGITLKQFLKKEGQVTQELGLNILKQISQGMEAVHKEGIIHRDLKSSNIIINKVEAGNAQIKLLDFGTARAHRNDDEFITQTGVIVGTPNYLSPEQARGDELDERSDIYSLGCLAYELFSGNPPFRGDTIIDTIEMHLTKPPIPISEVTENLDKRLTILISKMLEKAPANRIQSMKELKKAIEELDTEQVPLEIGEKKSSKPTSLLFFVLPALVIVLSLITYFMSSYLMSPPVKVAKSKPKRKKKTKEPTLFDENTLSNPMDAMSRSPKTFLFLKNEDAPKLTRCAKQGIRIPSVIVDGYDLSDKQIKEITALKPEWILLSRANVQDNHVIMLSQCASIQELKFCFDPAITKKGLRSLKNLPNLTHLSVRGCDIDDSCLKEIKDLPDLEALDLEYNPKISRGGLLKLAGHKNLKSIGIYKTGVKLKKTELDRVIKKLGIQRLFVTTTYDTPKAFKFMDDLRKDTKEDSLFNHTGALLTDLRVHYSDYNKPIHKKRPAKLD